MVTLFQRTVLNLNIFCSFLFKLNASPLDLHQKLKPYVLKLNGFSILNGLPPVGTKFIIGGWLA